MTKVRRIYLLSPKELSPETIAVTFAKTSRSPKSFDAIAEELTDDRSAQFHEKWVIGYGHASVAEHAVLHVAVENVSRLAIETIEGNRLASYTEKSTRYQHWDADAFYMPEELKGQALESEFIAACKRLFSAYQRCLPMVQFWLKESQFQQEDESDRAFERRLRSASADICRFLLPAASLANVGITMNARTLEYAICKMLSSPLDEVRSIGEQLRKVGQREAPTLIKYAVCNDYLVTTRGKMSGYAADIPQKEEMANFSLIDWDRDGEIAVLAAILFRFTSNRSYQDCLNFVRDMSESQMDDLLKELMEGRGPFDQPLREFEYARMNFEAVMDQGAYFEFKRHRMMTQTVQPLGTSLGFAIPKGISASGCESIYLDAMREAATVYNKMVQWKPAVASYVVPNGFNRRVLFTLNLREAFHLCRLRAADNAHFSIRRIAQQLVETIRAIYPHLGRYLDAPQTSWQAIESEYFSSLAAH